MNLAKIHSFEWLLISWLMACWQAVHFVILKHGLCRCAIILCSFGLCDQPILVPRYLFYVSYDVVRAMFYSVQFLRLKCSFRSFFLFCLKIEYVICERSMKFKAVSMNNSCFLELEQIYLISVAKMGVQYKRKGGAVFFVY